MVHSALKFNVHFSTEYTLIREGISRKFERGEEKCLDRLSINKSAVYHYHADGASTMASNLKRDTVQITSLYWMLSIPT